MYNNKNKFKMKPKSKKSDQIVECNNIHETLIVFNHVWGIDKKNMAHWRYVEIKNQETNIQCDINMCDSKLPIISFEEWKSLPDEEFILPKKWCINGSENLAEYFKKIGVINLSGCYNGQYYYIKYDGKWDCELSTKGMTLITWDQFKDHFLGEKEDPWSFSLTVTPEMMHPLGATIEEIKIEYNDEISGSLTEPKKIIGYKLIKHEYKEAVKAILGEDNKTWFDSFFDLNIGKYNYNFAKSNNYHVDSFNIDNKLKTSGVLDLWFEPVYESSTEQKIIDYIFKRSGFVFTNDEIIDIIKLVNDK